MVYIDTTCTLENFRRFLIQSTCMSFIPDSYIRDPDVFPEKEGETGSIYIEAADKVSLKRMRDITFVNAQDILGIIYVSKSGNTRLKWRESRGDMGKLTGDASTNSLVNLFSSRVLTKEYTDQLLERSEQGTQEGSEPQEGRQVDRATSESSDLPVEEEPIEGNSESMQSNENLEGTLNVEGDV